MAEVESAAHDRTAGAPDPSASSANSPVLARGQANGHNGHGPRHGHGGDGEGNGALNVEDPRTRLLLEQILTTLSQEETKTEEKKAQSLSLAHYVTVARRRWRPMLFVMLVAMGAVGWKLKPDIPLYTATATMLLPTSTAPTMSADNLANIITGKPASGGQVDTQIAIIEGPTLVGEAFTMLQRQKAWKHAGLQPEMLKDVRAAAPVSPELIDITVTATSEALAKAMANELIDAYIARSIREGNKTFNENLKYVGAKVVDIKHQLDDAKRKLQDYKVQSKVFDVGTRLTTISAQIQQLQSDSQKADAEVASGPTSTLVLSDAATTSLQQKATEADSKLNTTLHEYLPQSPEAVKAKQEADSAHALYQQRVGVMINTARAHAAEMHRELAQAQADASTLPEKEFKLTELLGRVDLLTNTYKTLSNNLTNMELQNSAKVATAQNLTPATTATKAVRTWHQAIIVAFLCGLVLASIAAFLLEQTDHTLHSTDDLESLLPNTTLLGSLPFQKKKSERRLLPASGAGGSTPLLLESCRIVRSNLAFSTLETPARSILVSSADPGEGKSLCALNLATVMAFDGRRVILIDCDLRRPVQHMLNGLPLEPGVSNVLAGEATWEQAVKATNVNNLWVMPAGTLPPNPPELLGSGACRQMLQDLKENYDMVILDSPPVMSLTDAQVLCTVADGVVMVVGADSTSKPHVRRAQAMLRHAGGRLLGVILNKIQQANNPDAYGAYYSFYGSGNPSGRQSRGFLTRGN